MIFNSDSYDALMAMEEARTGHYGEDYFDNGRDISLGRIL